MNVSILLVSAALVAPAPGPLSVDVAANRSSVRTGDTVNFTIVVRDDEDPPTASAEVRIDQRLPSSLRYVWGTDGAVVSNTLVQWVVPIGPARSGSVSATYTVTADPPSGVMKLSTTSSEVVRQVEAAGARRSSLLGSGLSWPVALMLTAAAGVVWAGVRRRHRR